MRIVGTRRSPVSWRQCGKNTSGLRDRFSIRSLLFVGYGHKEEPVLASSGGLRVKVLRWISSGRLKTMNTAKG